LRVTADSIITNWIIGKYKNNSDNIFYSYDFESEVPGYGRLVHQKTYTVSTYSRAFRKMRESNTLEKFGYELEEVEHFKSKVKGWKVKKQSLK